MTIDNQELPRVLKDWQNCPESDILINNFEEQHVHQVYEEIADSFSHTRYKAWPVVEQFVLEQPVGSIGVDIGCGNGKNMGISTVDSSVCGRFIMGCDNCMGLLRIADSQVATTLKGHGDCCLASNMCLPFKPASFDFALSIAVLHHFASPARRLEALRQVLGSIKTGGRCLVFVWALEQEVDSRRNFGQQEVFVDFKVKTEKGTLNSKSPSGQINAQKNLRYYHMFKQGELEELVEQTGLGELIKSGYDKSNCTKAWGFEGHEITALIAKALLNDGVLDKARMMLDGEQLEYAVLWPDRIKGLSSYNHSYSSLHYVDTLDNPPSQCRLDLQLDCPDGHCVVGAIKLFASVVKECALNASVNLQAPVVTSRYSLFLYSLFSNYATVPTNPPTCKEQLKYLIHLTGDIHQPLHVCGKYRGGNDYIIKFGNAHYNLHSLWDARLIEDQLKTNFKNSLQAYADYLVDKFHVSDVTQCHKYSENGVCPEEWALASNHLNCNVVWTGLNRMDAISERYHSQAVAVIEAQLFKSGRRMAGILNELFAS